MAHKKGGWYGEPGRHALARRGIKSKGVTVTERELRKATQEFLAEPTVVEKEVVHVQARDTRLQPIVVDVTDQLVEDYEEWAFDRLEDRLNELDFWSDLDKDDGKPQSEKELFDRIGYSDAPDDVYSRLQALVWRDNPDLTADQMYRVANDAVTEGVKLVAHNAWQDMHA